MAGSPDQPRVPFNLDPDRVIGALISAVNFSEVMRKLLGEGLAEEEADEALATLGLRPIPFDAVQARSAARLAAITTRAGLWLADRACLGLGLVLDRPILTADRAWAALDVGASVILVR